MPRKVSQTFEIKRAAEILKLSEEQLFKVLKGQTKLPEKKVAEIALEIYKRRIPMKVENEGMGNQVTMIKIVKNHLPNHSGEVVDVTPIEKAAQEVIEVQKSKAELLNEKIKKEREAVYSKRARPTHESAELESEKSDCEW